MADARTFESILEEMLDDAPDDIDKREGSVLYDALAPAAKKLAEFYAELEVQNRLAHAQTSSGEALRRRGADFGIDPLPAVASQRRGTFADASGGAFDVPIGSRFGAEGVVYRAAERLAAGEFRLICERAGAIGNHASGPLLPLDYIPGLSSAELAEVLVPGEEEESDDSFRDRLFAKVRTPPTSGNRSAYRGWALEVPGVGDAYVVPRWNGPNTVKVVVLGTDKLPAAAGVVQAVKDYIDPDTGLGEGMGEGAAPAGAVTTVVAAAPVAVHVSASVTLTGSRTLSQVQADFEEAITAHLAGIAFGADRNVRYARIGTLLLDTAGVQDYVNLQVNGGTGNVVVAAGSVAVKGTVTLT